LEVTCCCCTSQCKQWTNHNAF